MSSRLLSLTPLKGVGLVAAVAFYLSGIAARIAASVGFTATLVSIGIAIIPFVAAILLEKTQTTQPPDGPGRNSRTPTKDPHHRQQEAAAAAPTHNATRQNPSAHSTKQKNRVTWAPSTLPPDGTGHNSHTPTKDPHHSRQEAAPTHDATLQKPSAHSEPPQPEVQSSQLIALQEMMDTHFDYSNDRSTCYRLIAHREVTKAPGEPDYKFNQRKSRAAYEQLQQQIAADPDTFLQYVLQGQLMIGHENNRIPLSEWIQIHLKSRADYGIADTIYQILQQLLNSDSPVLKSLTCKQWAQCVSWASESYKAKDLPDLLRPVYEIFLNKQDKEGKSVFHHAPALLLLLEMPEELLVQQCLLQDNAGDTPITLMDYSGSVASRHFEPWLEKLTSQHIYQILTDGQCPDTALDWICAGNPKQACHLLSTHFSPEARMQWIRERCHPNLISENLITVIMLLCDKNHFPQQDAQLATINTLLEKLKTAALDSNQAVFRTCLQETTQAIEGLLKALTIASSDDDPHPTRLAVQAYLNTKILSGIRQHTALNKYKLFRQEIARADVQERCGIKVMSIAEKHLEKYRLLAAKNKSLSHEQRQETS